MTSTYSFLICIVAAAVFSTGSALKCYSCTSATDSKCSDPMTPEESKAIQCTSDALKDVADFYNKASKKIQDWSSSLGVSIQAKPVDANLQCSKIEVAEGDKKVTIRGCAIPPTESFDPCKTIMEKYSTGSAKVTFCDICKSDYCNGSSTLKMSSLLLLPIFAILLSQIHQ